MKSPVWRLVSWWIRQRVPPRKAEPILGDLAEDYRQRQRGSSRIAANVWLIRESLSMISAYADRQDPARKSRVCNLGRREDLRGLAQDVRFTLRLLARDPWFVLAAVATLGLGVGANVAVFSTVRTVLLSELPYPDATALVEVSLLTSRDLEGGMAPNVASFEALAQHHSLFSSLGAAQGGVGEEIVGNQTEADLVRTRRISEAFGSVTGLQPLAGRLFDASDFTSDGRVALISQRLWVSRFGRGDVVGETIRLFDGVYDVVGVVPNDFDLGRRSDEPADIWLPLIWNAKDRSPSSGNFNLSVVGRLAPGLSLEEARRKIALLDGILPAGSAAHQVRGARLRPLRERYASQVRSGLLMLQGVSMLLLLIACSNLAHLFMAHASVRQKEFVIRAALGASGWRLARLLVTEAGMVALAGGVLGVALAWVSVPALVAAASWALPRASEVQVSGIDLAAGLMLASLTVLAFGVIPAWISSRGDLLETLRGGATATTSRRILLRRSGLVAAEVAIATVLLTAGGLLAKSFYRVASLPLGFDATGLLVADVTLQPGAQWTPGRMQAMARDLTEHLRSHFGPGNSAVGTSMPYSSTVLGPSAPLTAAGYVGSPGSIPYRSVSPDYFSLLRIPILRGRSFLPSDDARSSLVVIVNEQFVREFGGGRDLVGQGLRIGPRDVTVVGIVGDTRFRPASPPDAAVYWSTHQRPGVSIIVRASDLSVTTRELRDVVRTVDAALVVMKPEFVETKIARQLAQRRFYMMVLSLLGGLGLTLAIVGIWGVVTHFTRQRTKESAIRVALGARPGQVTRLVVLQGLAPVAIGLAVGGVGSWWSARAMESNAMFRAQLYEMTPQDPATLVVCVSGLFVFSALACWFPAARASRVDPASVLRAD
jgi:predicted permease